MSWRNTFPAHRGGRSRPPARCGGPEPAVRKTSSIWTRRARGSRAALRGSLRAHLAQPAGDRQDSPARRNNPSWRLRGPPPGWFRLRSPRSARDGGDCGVGTARRRRYGRSVCSDRGRGQVGAGSEGRRFLCFSDTVPDWGVLRLYPRSRFMPEHRLAIASLCIRARSSAPTASATSPIRAGLEISPGGRPRNRR